MASTTSSPVWTLSSSTISPKTTPISKAVFSPVDYVLFIGMLLASSGIGLYYAIRGRRSTQTAKQLILANKELSIAPVALALAATFISAVSILGYSAEIYQYGTMFCYYGLMYVIAYPIAAYVFLPVFYRLDISSCYEYLELRFNRWVRFGASSVFTFQVILYMAVVLYAPALALSSVTNIPMVASVFATGVVATFYTSLGGAKAVVWTNSMQMVLVLVGFLAVIVGGSIHIGGLSNVWSLAQSGSRIQFSDFRADPTVRHSFWSLMFGGTFMILTLFAANQMSVQRYLSLPSLKSAQIAVLCNVPLNWLALAFYTFAGLIMYATYHECDPRKAGFISRPDQLLPYYVMDKLGYMAGLPGLFVSALYSAGLSALGGGYSALAAVILTDFIKPAYESRKGYPMEDRTAATVSKFLVCCLGCICIAVAFMFTFFQSTVLQIALSIFGIAGGPILGTFCLGMFVPWANWKGALCGLMISVACMFALGVSAMCFGVRAVSLPIGEDSCYASNSTSSNLSFPSGVPDDFGRVLTTSGNDGGAIELVKLSYQYYSLVGAGLVMVFGIVISAITGFVDPSSVDPKLLVPVYRLCCCLPKRWQGYFKCGVEYRARCQKEKWNLPGEKTDDLIALSKRTGRTAANGESATKYDDPDSERARLRDVSEVLT